MDTMYIDDQIFTQANGHTYRRVLMRTSFRKGGKVSHKTVGNLTGQPDKTIEAVKLALQHKDELFALKAFADGGSEISKSVGAVSTLYQLAHRMGVARTLGPTQEGKRALWLVLARFLGARSRLAAVRCANLHAAREIIGLDPFHEDDLYATLQWVEERQEKIEKRLFRTGREKKKTDGLYLYDVTSTYLEGTQNELAAFGYNRDGKKGKRQIVYGLLCDSEGDPISIEAFSGNTADSRTFAHQLHKLQRRFGCRHITMVGDKGMIKGQEIEAMAKAGYGYITSITKSQIESLLKSGRVQLELFESALAEVEDHEEGVRYILRRNPLRAEEVALRRRSKVTMMRRKVEEANAYLAGHARAGVEVQRRDLRKLAGRLKIDRWVTIDLDPDDARALALKIDEEELAAVSKLDGCYAVKTNLPGKVAGAAEVHARYKDLSLVETAFRTHKDLLDVRPIYLRNEQRTRGHLLVVMLAYKLERALREAWKFLDIEVSEGIEFLKKIAAERVILGHTELIRVPGPDAFTRKLLEAVDVELPRVLPEIMPDVATRRKLPSRRKT